MSLWHNIDKNFIQTNLLLQGVWSINVFAYIYDRILAPTTYIFFASALPVIAFGEQLSRDTGFFLHILGTEVENNWNNCYHFCFLMRLLVSVMILKELSFLRRWKLEHGGDFSFYCSLWYYTFRIWRATPSDTRSCRTNSNNVHLFIQLCEGKGRFGTETISGLGWMVI